MAIVRQGHSVASYECEHCSEQVGPEDVSCAVIRFAFADDSGEVVFYARDFGILDGPEIKAQCFPGRRLDPQVQPRFEPDEAVTSWSGDAIDAQLIEEQFGRPISLKRVWRELMQDWANEANEDDALCFVQKLGEGLWAVVNEADEEQLELAIEMEAELHRRDELGELTWCSLDESEPYELPTHASPERLSGRWQRWVPEDVFEALEDGQIEIFGALSHDAAERVMSRAFDVARLGYRREVDEHGLTVFTDLCSPRDEPYGHDVPVFAVLQRAMYTGISVGDAARLTAEEIVGVMLKVWRVPGPKT